MGAHLSWSSRSRPNERRRKVERRLQSLKVDGDAPVPAGEVRAALESLGAVFAGFGAYLGSRADLLSLSNCRVLVDTVTEVEPEPLQDVRRRLEEAGLPDAWCEPQPFRCDLAAQWHRGRLPDGRPTVVRLVR